MIDYGDKRINVLDKKRIYLIDKINAYFRRVKESKNHPIMSKREICSDFDDRINQSLKVFK